MAQPDAVAVLLQWKQSVQGFLMGIPPGTLWLWLPLSHSEQTWVLYLNNGFRPSKTAL